MSIGKSASKGFMVFFIRNMLDKVLAMLAMIILARELSPYDFGLVSITEVLLFVITALGTTGISEYLFAYRAEDVRTIFKATFWFNLAITIVVILLFLVVVPFWADYQGDERIKNIGFISAAIFLCSQLQVIPKTLLAKTMQHQKEVIIQVPFIILVHLLRIGAALSGFGVYSLIVPSLIVQPVLTVFLYRGAEFYPGFKAYTNRWKEIFIYTKHLIGANLLSRITDQGDKIILSKLLGLEALGIYNIAVQLADLLTSPFITISNSLLASVLPKYANEKERFYKNYILFVKSFLFVVFPLLSVMIVSADHIIETLYGPKWLAATLPVQILLIYTAIKASTSSFDVLMSTLYLTKKTFKINFAYTPLHLVGVSIGAFFGIPGLAVSIVILKSLFANLQLRIITQTLQVSFSRWYKDILPHWLMAFILVMVFLVINVFFISSIHLHPLLLTTIIGLSYMLVYYMLVKKFMKKELQNISSFLQSTTPRASKFFNAIFGI